MSLNISLSQSRSLNVIRNHLVKELWKSVHICQRYYQTSSGLVYFWDTMWIQTMKPEMIFNGHSRSSALGNVILPEYPTCTSAPSSELARLRACHRLNLFSATYDFLLVVSNPVWHVSILPSVGYVVSKMTSYNVSSGTLNVNSTIRHTYSYLYRLWDIQRRIMAACLWNRGRGHSPVNLCTICTSLKSTDLGLSSRRL